MISAGQIISDQKQKCSYLSNRTACLYTKY